MVIETSRTAGIEIADEYCSRCGICVAVCPFEAISKDEEQNKIILDVEVMANKRAKMWEKMEAKDD